MAELDYNQTAASNTAINALSVLGSAAANTIDNLFREFMSDGAKAITRHVTKTVGTYTAAKTDHNQLWRCTGAVEIDLTAAATLTDGWCLWVRANGGAVTIDPNASEQIDGSATSLVIPDGMTVLIVCTGAAFFTWGYNTVQSLGTPLTITSTDAGATAGPTLDLYRDSASPAVSDILGSIDFNGEDSAGNKQLFGRITTVITDPTSTSEDGSMRFWATTAGTITESMSLTGSSITMHGSVADKTFNQDSNDDSVRFSGGNSAGAELQIYGSTHATEASNYKFRTGGSVRYGFDHSLLQHQFVGAFTTDSTVRLGQNSTDTPGTAANVNGVGVGSLGQLSASANGAAHSLNTNADGTNLAFRSNTALQGSVSIAGAVCSFNTFFGSHWSQLADGSKPEILRGTICESIAQMSAWPDEGSHLPCFKVSDTAGSKAVYGVFAWWDDDWEATNDAHIGALGAYMVRIDAGETVSIGDYIESAGNGCGRVQADDILHASTVGKVTSTAAIETYPDGSYLVPCTLHCG